MSGGIFKKTKKALRPPENRWSKGRVRWGLEAPDAPELGSVALHLVGEGTLGPTEGLGDGAVGDLPVCLPHTYNGIRVGVKLTQTGEKAVEQVAVGDDALDGRGLVRHHVQQGVLAVLSNGDVQRGYVAGAVVLTNEAVAVACPYVLLRANASPVGLFFHADAGRLSIVGVADFLGNWNLGLGAAVVDEGLVFFRVVFHKSTPLDVESAGADFVRRTEKTAVDIVLP